jgi:hypothetical protein
MFHRRTLFLAVVSIGLLGCGPKEEPVDPAVARGIAKEAYVYGFPMVDSYRIVHSYYVNANDPEYKGGWNEVHNIARVYTPEDRAVQTPNSDTPYSMVGADLRAEPLVFTVPAIPEGRYYSLQFIDLYTHNFAYIGSRTTGNGGGNYLLAGPGWDGPTPAGIDAVIRCETQLAMVAYRTQLFGPNDIDKVKAIQEGYRVHPLSHFTGTPAPPSAPPIDFIAPLSVADERNSLEFFNVLNFVLQFCPAHPSETELMTRFSTLDIGAGRSIDIAALKPEQRQTLEDGRADAWAAYQESEKKMATGELTSGDLFGTRDYLKNNYLYRMMAAVNGIYGNSKEEAIYPAYLVDASGQPMDGSTGKYTITFAKDQLPPVDAFWSITMYEMPSRLLVDNPLDRYLINSAMLPKLKKEKDGSIVIYVQHASPGPKLQSNWLPAPKGPFFVAMRLYWPKPEALDGTWQRPPLLKV